MSSSAGAQPIVAVPDNEEQEEKVSKPRRAWVQFGHFSCPEGLKIQDAIARFYTSKELKVGRFCQPYASKKGKIKPPWADASSASLAQAPRKRSANMLGMSKMTTLLW